MGELAESGWLSKNWMNGQKWAKRMWNTWLDL